MPAELMEAPIDTSVTTISKPVQELRGLNLDIKSILPDRIRDEFDNRDKVSILKPIPIIIEGQDELAEEFNKILEKNFEYYSRTRDLEVDTQRTRLIQTVVDKLTVGTDIQTRVVIMRRGRAPNALVVPDGTIFITQSLLNKLDSLDEIAGVLAHEVGHLINKTSVRRVEASIGSFGVGFVHEAACDAMAPDLLEKAGFKSWAFGTGIEKIQGYGGRGTIHQSGLSRASQSVGGHMAVDRTTSSQAEMPIPKILSGKFSRTNLEIITDKIEERRSISMLMWGGVKDVASGMKKKVVENLLDPLEPTLKQLHPKDFYEVYRKLVADRAVGYGNSQPRTDMRIADWIIRNRLEQIGYSNAQVNLFLVRNLNLQTEDSSESEDAYMFTETDDLTKVVDLFVNHDADLGTDQMVRYLFDSDPQFYSSSHDQLLKLMTGSIYDATFENRKEGLPVTRETLLDNLEKLSQLKYISENSFNATVEAILSRYILVTYLSLSKEVGSELDEDQIKDFFQEVKDREIPINLRMLITYIEARQWIKGTTGIITSENIHKVVESARAVFETEPFNLTTEKMDQFFNEFTKEELTDKEKKELLTKFLLDAQDYLKRENIPDEQRLEFVNYLSQKIDITNFQSSIPWIDALQVGSSWNHRAVRESDLAFNDAVMKFNLKTILGVTFLTKDSDQFYDFMNLNMSKIDPYLNNLSKIQLINLCQGLFRSGETAYLLLLGKQSMEHTGGVSSINILDYEKLCSLSAIKRIIEIDERPDFKDLTELNGYIRISLSDLAFGYMETSKDLYSDRLLQLIIGKGIRDNFERILASGIEEKDYMKLYDFLEANYPKGSQREQFLREINKLYLRSPNISFDLKVEHMVTYFNQVGPEAMVILADQIQDVETYRYFRERLGARLKTYLDAQELVVVNVIAGADLLSSDYVRKFEKLLVTCQDDPEVSKQVSTELAGQWFSTMLGTRYTGGFIKYDVSQQKFILNAEGRAIFRSLPDFFATLKELPDLQKFAIIHKSLTDTEGALTSPENRKKLSELLVKSLGVEKGFVASVLSAACTEADAKLLGFPVSSMLIPLVFKALDIKEVDIDKLKETDVYINGKHSKLGEIISSDQALLDILQSDTRGISVFGEGYQNQPNSPAALLAQESDQQFLRTTNHLNELLISNLQSTKERERAAEIDPALEAVIRGIETSGALGIRSLQLAAQFETFSPAIEKRLSETFDSNPGMEKLRFWENLNKLALDAAERGDGEIEQFLRRLTLGDYIGGGSLQTTYAAMLDAGTPSARKIVVKMRNPNVDQFILESYRSASKTLDFVGIQKGAGKSKQHSETGRVLIDLAQKWCLDDLNDTEYVANDDLFRHTIDEYNQKIGRQMFYAPEREFTSLKLKSETLSPGQTVNQYLKDPNVEPVSKKEVVEALTRFFIHQLKGQQFQSSEGQYRLIHSDPHIGNYIVDLTDSSNPKYGVIDRSMYLKLKQEDIKVLEKLILPGNDTDFVHSTIERVLDINHVRGVNRAIITGNVFIPVAMEYRRQQARGSVNRLELMRTMFQAFEDARVYAPFSIHRLDIPLNFRLMIRNIGAFQELGRRHGVDFEQLYKEAT